MRSRPLQLVCLALLLATLRLADPAALAPDDFALRAGMLNVLFRAELAEQGTHPAPRQQPAKNIPAPQLRPAPEPTFQASEAPRPMAPPAGQSAAVQLHTSFLRA